MPDRQPLCAGTWPLLGHSWPATVQPSARTCFQHQPGDLPSVEVAPSPGQQPFSPPLPSWSGLIRAVLGFGACLSAVFMKELTKSGGDPDG